MSDELKATSEETISAINAMVKTAEDPDYYLGLNAHTGQYRIWGDVTDSHYVTRLYAVLIFEDDHLYMAFEDCNIQRAYYNDPDYLTRVLTLLHPGSRHLALSDQNYG